MGEYDGGEAGEKDRVETYIAYNNDMEAEWIFVPVGIYTDAYNNSGNWAMSSCKCIYYDGESNGYVNGKGQVTCQRAEYDASNYIMTYLSYDTWGNVLTTTDGKGNVTTHAYDGTYHSFPTSVTNALTHSTSTQYDNRMRPERVIDANGNSTWTQYDNLGRLIKVWAPYDHNGNDTVP